MSIGRSAIARPGHGLVVFACALTACTESRPAPLPAVPPVQRADASARSDAAPTRLDSGLSGDAAGRVDVGAAVDAGAVLDAAGLLDAAATIDAAPGDSSAIGPDTGPTADLGVAIPDAGPPDTGPPDTGVTVPDTDGDTISDADEGDGLVDTDGDLLPDSQDDDSDGDGILDATEAGDTDLATRPWDHDLDGTPDFRDPDSDGDGIPDRDEGVADPDGDAAPNFRDGDSDGDGVSDQVETGADADLDGTPNYLDLDSDGDTIDDRTEGGQDSDADSTPDFLDLDSDGDSIDDQVEGTADPDNDRVPAYLDHDSDEDGIDDRTEGTADPDGDGQGNWLDIDADGDTIRDDHDGVADTDGDGAPNYLDLDSDDDTIDDAAEARDSNVHTPPRDSDLDQTPDFLDVDSDDDMIADEHEGTADSDGDGLVDRYDIDSDNDSILDDVESGDTATVTPPVDTDSDNVPDYLDTDSDDDTIDDLTEDSVDSDNDGTPNFRDADSDADTWSDADEAGDADLLTAPVDTDSDGIADFLDVDSDSDGLADANEPGCPAGPNRLTEDSDTDGYVDMAEVAYGSDPCAPASAIDDFYFVLMPGGPGDDDLLVFDDTNIDRADLAINVDTTGSMDGEIANLQTSLSNSIIPGVSQVVPDSAFAVSSFDDYPILPFGRSNDLPFRLGARVTTRSQTAQAAVDGMQTHSGGDGPESGIESLYQIATGAGTTWPGGSVAPFDPNANQVPGVADGTIGGVGFRDDALPIVVHVTDAPSHTQQEYQLADPAISAASTQAARAALANIGARVVTIADQSLTRLGAEPFTPICQRSNHRAFGVIDPPAGTDVDWFELTGVGVGANVTVESFARRLGSPLDTMVGVFHSGGLIASDDDGAGNLDSRLQQTLTGQPPYYVAITSYADRDFNASGAGSAGWWFLEITVDGRPFVTNPIGCRTDDADAAVGATQLVDVTFTSAPNLASCVSTCEAQLDPFTLPETMSVATRATIPPCAWDAFGGGRPAACAANQCCTGLDGAGVATPSSGQCPLTFQIAADGSGLGDAVVTAIEALVKFSTFTLTTVVRPDPQELSTSGLDTTCFIHGVVPTNATVPNTCAPAPTAVDRTPPSPELDSWENVVPGTVLTFQVNALNQSAATGAPCAERIEGPQLFRAFIDVVADGVTAVDTKDVIVIVPPLPPTGNN